MLKQFIILFFSLIIVLLIFSCNNIEKANNKPTTLSNQNEQPTNQSAAAQSQQSQIQTNQPVITFIELGSVNCMPCRMMQPVIKQVEEKYAEKVKIIFYDVWTREGQPYGVKYGIKAIPTQIFLDKNGNEFYRHTGFLPFEKIKKIFQTQGLN